MDFGKNVLSNVCLLKNVGQSKLGEGEGFIYCILFMKRCMILWIKNNHGKGQECIGFYEGYIVGIKLKREVNEYFQVKVIKRKGCAELTWFCVYGWLVCPMLVLSVFYGCLGYLSQKGEWKNEGYETSSRKEKERKAFVRAKINLENVTGYL